MHFSAKKLFLVGFFVILLVAIPVSVYFIQQQTVGNGHAEKSTNLSFTPDSTASSPITKNIGDTVSLDVMVDPGTNLVSFVKLEIDYDPDKLATTGAGFQVNSSVFPTVLAGPIYSPGKILVSLSAGIDLTKAIQTKAKAGTLTMKALSGTGDSTPTLITYSTNSQAVSVGSNDQSSENVLAGSSPATIIINGAPGSASPTQPQPTSVTSAPVPTDVIATDVPQPTTPPEATTAPSPAPTASATAPTCTSLTADATSGTAPFAVNFTANGTSASSTISKATFNFGDGQVSDVTTGGGIGTATVTTQISHSYTTAGTFQATAILTDATDGVSNSTNCAQTITVNGSAAVNTPTPTLAATGSTAATVGFGVVTLLMIIGGGLLFFIL